MCPLKSFDHNWEKAVHKFAPTHVCDFAENCHRQVLANNYGVWVTEMQKEKAVQKSYL